MRNKAPLQIPLVAPLLAAAGRLAAAIALVFIPWH